MPHTNRGVCDVLPRLGVLNFLVPRNNYGESYATNSNPENKSVKAPGRRRRREAAVLVHLLGVHPERRVARALGVDGHASREQVLADGALLRQQPSLLAVEKEVTSTPKQRKKHQKYGKVGFR